MKKNIKISLKNYMFFRYVFCFIIYKLGFINKHSFRIYPKKILLNRFRKKYSKDKLKKLNYIIESPKKDIDFKKTIWVFWFQGFDNAPEVVKLCNLALKKNYKDYNIVYLSKDNINEYIKLPNFVYEKFEKKVISVTHFSDILRLALLSTYGGLWVDATTLCTGNNDLKFFQQYNLFVYREGTIEEDEPINMGNWLLWSVPNNEIITDTLNMLLDYWKNYNYLCDYFIFHILFKIACDIHKSDWKNVPYLNQVDNHILFANFFNLFDEKLFFKICNLTDFHKLSYKYDKNKSKKGTLFEKLINVYDMEKKS